MCIGVLQVPDDPVGLCVLLAARITTLGQRRFQSATPTPSACQDDMSTVASCLAPPGSRRRGSAIGRNARTGVLAQALAMLSGVRNRAGVASTSESGSERQARSESRARSIPELRRRESGCCPAAQSGSKTQDAKDRRCIDVLLSAICLHRSLSSPRWGRQSTRQVVLKFSVSALNALDGKTRADSTPNSSRAPGIPYFSRQVPNSGAAARGSPPRPNGGRGWHFLK